MKTTRTELLLLTLLACLVPPRVVAATWFLNAARGNDSNPCKQETAACKTIGHAIALAASNDSINIAAGTYNENLSIPVSLKLNGTNAVTTIIDGGANDHTVSILNTALVVSLNRLTIRNGAGLSGAGIINWGKLTLSSSTVSGNSLFSESSVVGAGVYNLGTLTVSNSTISGNGTTANYSYGGGIYSSGTLIINNSTVSGNSLSGYLGGGGAAIFIGAGTANISSSTIAGNTSSSSGSGIYMENANVLVKNTIVAGNTTGENCYGTATGVVFAKPWMTFLLKRKEEIGAPLGQSRNSNVI